MAIDEDALLLGFFKKYENPDKEEEEQLRLDVCSYVGKGNFGGQLPMEEQNTTGESMDDVSV